MSSWSSLTIEGIQSVDRKVIFDLYILIIIRYLWSRMSLGAWKQFGKNPALLGTELLWNLRSLSYGL